VAGTGLATGFGVGVGVAVTDGRGDGVFAFAAGANVPLDRVLASARGEASVDGRGRGDLRTDGRGVASTAFAEGSFDAAGEGVGAICPVLWEATAVVAAAPVGLAPCGDLPGLGAEEATAAAVAGDAFGFGILDVGLADVEGGFAAATPPVLLLLGIRW
jgi:hypothetical protein